MKILTGKLPENQEEATLAAYSATGKKDMSPDIAILFVPVINADKLHDETEKGIRNAIHGKYGRYATWFSRRWFVPIPEPAYEAIPIPRMVFTIQMYLVAAITVQMADFHRTTVFGEVGKPQKLAVPMCFLQAILDNDLERFELAAKDGECTAWNVPGLKQPLRLPNDFVSGLAALLRLKSVFSWLLDFGHEGRAIAPLVVGTLLGLQFRDVMAPLPIENQSFQRETVIDTLSGMFGSARAKEMYERSLPDLKPGMTNKEAIARVLQEEGKGR